jgi:hypothetical protein
MEQGSEGGPNKGVDGTIASSGLKPVLIKGGLKEGIRDGI